MMLIHGSVEGMSNWLPLPSGELRDAVSVKAGETSSDASKLINNMPRSLLDSYGSLVVVDEEHLTFISHITASSDSLFPSLQTQT